MTPVLMLTAMLFITDNPRPLVYAREYPTHEACSEALLTVGRDAICIGGEESLAPTTSLIPRPRPMKGGE